MFCCDPGLLSGVAVLAWSPRAGIQLIRSMECHLMYVGEAARQFVTELGRARAAGGVERFTITAKTAELGSPDWSLKVCGAIEWLVWEHWHLDPEDTVIYQAPGDAKKLVDNARLRKAGLWHKGGAGHANDALRHGLYRYARLGVLDA